MTRPRSAPLRTLLTLLTGIGLIALAQHIGLRAAAGQPPAPHALEPNAPPRPQPRALTGPVVARPHAAIWQSPPAAAPVTSYKLRARLDPLTHRVSGTGMLSWRNTSRLPQEKIYLHLYLNAFASNETVFMRSEAGSGFRGGGMPTDLGGIEVHKLYARRWGAELWPGAARHSPGDPRDATDIMVPLPHPLQPGETLELDMSFTSQLPRVSHRTGFEGSFHMVAQWFPKLARLQADGSWAHFSFHRLGEFYADFGDYDVTIEAPSEYLVGATGNLLESAPLEGGYVSQRYQVERVHDFAFTAWDRFEELVDQHQGVALRCLFPSGDDDLARLQLNYVKRGLDHYGARYGRYPYRTLTVVQPPAAALDAGGMEYPTLITTGGSFSAHALDIRLLENVTVHELGHQWFYGLLASNEHDWPFLDEGLTTYAQNEVLESWHPQASAAQLLGVSVSNISVMRLLAAGSELNGAVARPVTEYASGSDYGNLVYRRTGLLLETLARVYGAESMRRALARYTRTQRFGHPGPEDLFTAIAAEMGTDAAQTARLGLFGRGWLDYQLEDPARLPERDGVQHGSVLLRRLGTLNLPVEIAFIDERGGWQLQQDNSYSDHVRLHYQGDYPLAAVLLDPHDKLLLDQNLANNAVALDGPKPARRVHSQAASFAQLIAAAVAP